MDSVIVFGNENEAQATQSCFIGGKPKLPNGTDIPDCSLCGRDQTFYFQIAFPEEHVWSGLTLAQFSCTSCADKDLLIPQMLNGPLPGVNVPDGFLIDYMKNFSCLVFETALGVTRHSYEEKIRFRALCSSANISADVFGLLSDPTWVLEDESPGVYGENDALEFVFQLAPHLEFSINDNADAQIEIGLSGDEERSPFRHYELFIGNTCYYFGTTTEQRHVYIITQVS